MIENSAYQLISKREPDLCEKDSEFDGHLNLRILSIFIILIASMIGSFVPVVFGLSKKEIPLSKIIFFIARYFGQGVIFATAFTHLLQPANAALTASCLPEAWKEYPYAFGICMAATFAIYLMEIITRHYIEKLANLNNNDSEIPTTEEVVVSCENTENIQSNEFTIVNNESESLNDLEKDLKNKNDISSVGSKSTFSSFSKQVLSYKNQLVSICILEFGIIFHSVFVGLSLGVAGKEFKTLFCVLVFHQMFEGAACGTRIVELGRKHLKTQIIFGMMYSLTTPIAIAIGVGVRHSLSMHSKRVNIVSGCFDSLSAGILIYNSFELLFMIFDEYKENLKMKLFAYFVTCCGVGIMALLGKWA